MFLSNRHRRVLVAKLNVRNEANTPSDIPAYAFDDITNIIKSERESKSTKFLFQGDSKQIRIKDIKEFKNDKEIYICLLLSLSDKDAPNAVYEEFDSGEVRKFSKEENEGSSTTSHVLIGHSLNDANLYYSILIEKVPILTTPVINRYLNSLLKNSSFLKTYNKENERKAYRPIFEILGRQSNTLRRALEFGTVQDIELVAHKEIRQGFDEYPFLKEQREEIKLIVQEKVNPSFFEDLIRELRGNQSYSSFEHMFVRIKDAEGDIRQSEIDPDVDFLERTFIQTEILRGFDPPLEQAHSSIRDDVFCKMISLIGTPPRKVAAESEKPKKDAGENSSPNAYTKTPVLSTD